MIFVVCGKSRDGDKNTPCPLGILGDLCICLSYLPRTNSGLSNLGSYMDQLSGYRQSLTREPLEPSCVFPSQIPFLRVQEVSGLCCHPCFTGQDDEDNSCLV